MQVAHVRLRVVDRALRRALILGATEWQAMSAFRWTASHPHYTQGDVSLTCSRPPAAAATQRPVQMPAAGPAAASDKATPRTACA